MMETKLQWLSDELSGDLSDLWNALAQKYPDAWWLIDYIPARIADWDKFKQIELCYQKQENAFLRAEYANIEHRFIRVFTLLWSLNESLRDHNGHLETFENFAAFQQITQCALREQNAETFFFSDAEIICWISGLNVTVFTRKKEELDNLKNIVTTEGLFMRKIKP